MTFILLPLLLCHHFCGYFCLRGVKSCQLHVGPSCSVPILWEMAGCVPLYQLSWPSVLQVVLADPLGRQLCQDVVQVLGVGVAVAGQVGAKFCLVVNLVPHHCV